MPVSDMSPFARNCRATFKAHVATDVIGQVLAQRFVEDLRDTLRDELGPDYRQKIRDAAGISAIGDIEPVASIASG